MWRVLGGVLQCHWTPPPGSSLLPLSGRPATPTASGRGFSDGDSACGLHRVGHGSRVNPGSVPPLLGRGGEGAEVKGREGPMVNSAHVYMYMR